MQKEINQAINILRKGGIILYPTDTIWGIGCDATNSEAVDKIYRIKNREEEKSLIILVSNESSLKEITRMNPIKSTTTKPTTIIYPRAYGIANNILAKDRSVGIRIPQDNFCKKLIQNFGKPITSTSANMSGEKNPKKFSDITKDILDKIDYIVNLRKKEIMDEPSSIIKINNFGEQYTIRK